MLFLCKEIIGVCEQGEKQEEREDEACLVLCVCACCVLCVCVGRAAPPCGAWCEVVRVCGVRSACTTGA